MLRFLLQAPSPVATQAKRDGLVGIGKVDGANDVLRVSAPRNRDDQVTFLKQILQLLNENVLEGIIVSIGHDQAHIIHQAATAEWRSGSHENALVPVVDEVERRQ